MRDVMKRIFLLALIVLICLSSCQKGGNEILTLPAIFNNNMVLQQDSNVPVWGKANPGEEITVSANWDEDASAITENDGKWQVKIQTPKAGGPYEISVAGKNKTIIYKNVLIGEVWVCSGQSNMEMPMKGWPPNDLIEGSEEAIKSGENPYIRLFTVKRTISDKPENDCIGNWTECNPQMVADFSATAYFFGRKLSENLNIPIGLIFTSWGGTPAESWTPGSELKSMDDYSDDVEHIKNARAQIIVLNEWLATLDVINMAELEGDDIWKNLEFNDAENFSDELDDADWYTMELPGRWEDTDFGEFDGAIWFRKTITVDKKDGVYKLELGPIDDMDVTYFNGKKVGGYEADGFYSMHRAYDIPAELVRNGENIIAVRVIDNRGGGGFWGTPDLMKFQSNENSKNAVQLAGNWKYMPVAEFRNESFKIFGTNNKSFKNRPKLDIGLTASTPTTLFNGMINPIIPFGIRGAIWYQGESNVGRAAQYGELFPLMISSWRKYWNQGNFPFYFVQIAPYTYGKPDRSQYLREAQLNTLSLINTGMAITTDIGNVNNIHPANKKEVGERLALWALNKDYGFTDVVPSGPLYKSMKIEGKKIRIFFDYADMGLKSDGNNLSHFQICDIKKNFVHAKAKIDGNSVVVWNDKITEPIAVRFGWSNTAEPNLFNNAGLPASTFRTDNWMD